LHYLLCYTIALTPLEKSANPTVHESIERLIDVRTVDYESYFSHIEHTLAFDQPPDAILRLHFVKADASGEPRFRQLARLLVRYIAVFCFTAEKRHSLPEIERDELWMQARDLFRNENMSGQAGELLIYFLLEAVLHAPQALKKMPMTTNPKEERKGSDGVHIRWDETAGILEILFAEAKIYKSFSKALNDAFESMEMFHESRTKVFEVNTFTSGFSNLDSKLQKKVVTFIEGENAAHCRTGHACLIGFDWREYQCLGDKRRADFIKEFEDRYRAWATRKRDSLNEKITSFKHKHINFEFFFVPFHDVEMFRKWFMEELRGRS